MFLHESFEGYENSSLHMAVNPFFNASVGINKYVSDKDNYTSASQWRVGINYFLYDNLNYNLAKKEYKSSVWPWGYDTTYHKKYSLRSYSEQLRLDVSYIYHIKKENRWSFYGGLGVTIGSSLKSYVTINYSESSSVEFQGTTVHQPPKQNLPTKYRNETIKTKSQLGSCIYVPLGMNFRLGKKREFFKRLHLYGEMRLFVNSTTIPELNKTLVTGGIKGGIGLRVNF